MESTGLTPKDFKRLPKDGARFETLVCQLLEAMGYRILEKPAVGTEGGRDVLVERTLKDEMVERREKVVVQCKHYAHSGRADGDKEVGVWQNAMTRYKARGYLLVTDTRVTENLSRSFREFTEDEANYPRWAAFWDVDELITHLNKYPEVRDSFLPRESLGLPDELQRRIERLSAIYQLLEFWTEFRRKLGPLRNTLSVFWADVERIKTEPDLKSRRNAEEALKQYRQPLNELVSHIEKDPDPWISNFMESLHKYDEEIGRELRRYNFDLLDDAIAYFSTELGVASYKVDKRIKILVGEIGEIAVNL